ncbi:flagellar brake protein [Petrocella sp. FN5]|uniref:flagellar brake protein n=1 Tax=Petrocella sp. FN5 TaxID=3032002 RepID=UPI0023DB7568|nr:flagellar brake protein [Petrocella sp. FN5]MDF1616807.1 flagellar brake protein [Petrocella sp. FN5]
MYKGIEVGDKIELEVQQLMGEKQEKYLSKIQEVTETGEIIILAPMESGRIITLELNQNYGMCVYTSKGLYRCEVAVTERIRDDNLYLIKLEVQSALQKYQRRQYYRLDCMLTFHYKDDTNGNWEEGIILDISGGGIRFTSQKKLLDKKGVINHLQLNYDEEECHLYLSGVIVDSSNLKAQDNIYENRVVFDEITIEEREIIIKFIFEEERRRRKNKKGL